jgi:adenosylcobinamide-GDP ribazoletransferase
MRGTGTKPTRDPSSHPWWIRDLILAAGFLTRVPMPSTDAGDRLLMRTGWCFPLVGAAIGVFGGLLALSAYLIGVPVFASALVALAGTALLTGALHEDGLADLADGFGGGHDRDAKITIMRDSRIGSYGVLALILATGLKASAITTLLSDGDATSLIIAMAVAHGGARALIPPVTLWLSNASEAGLGKMAGRPKMSTVQISLAISAVSLLIMLPASTAVVAGVIGCAAAAGVAVLARHQIGGYTGDVLGAVEQAVEIAMLLALAAMIGA